MAEKKTEMSFGPAWIQALQDPGKGSQNPNCFVKSDSSNSSKYRYTIHEMIASFNPRKCRPPHDLSEHEECFVEHIQEPLYFTPVTAEESDLMSQNINCEFVVKKASKENGNEFSDGFRERSFYDPERVEGRVKNSSGEIIRKPPGMTGPGKIFDRNNPTAIRSNRTVGNNVFGENGSRFGFGAATTTGREMFQRTTSYDESKTNINSTTKKLSYPKPTNPADLTDMLLPNWRTNKTTAGSTPTSTTTTTAAAGPEGKSEWRTGSDAKSWRNESKKKETDPDDPSTDPQAIEYLNRKRASQTKINANARFISRREDINDLFKANKPDSFDEERDFFGNTIGGRNNSNAGEFFSRKPPGISRSYNRDRADYSPADKWGNYNQKSDRENGRFSQYNRYHSFSRNNQNDDFDRYGNGSDDEETRKNVPEWSKDDDTEFNIAKVGTFDDTGAFCEIGDDFGGSLEPDGEETKKEDLVGKNERPASSASRGKNGIDAMLDSNKDNVSSHAGNNSLPAQDHFKNADDFGIEKIGQSMAEMALDDDRTSDILNSIFKNTDPVLSSKNLTDDCNKQGLNNNRGSDTFGQKNLFDLPSNVPNNNDSMSAQTKSFFSDFEAGFGSSVASSSKLNQFFSSKDQNAGSFAHMSPLEKMPDYRSFEERSFQTQRSMPEPMSRMNMEESTNSRISGEVNMWYYCDPQGNIQGPFKAADMEDWFRSGFFSMDLMVRRGTDHTFKKLGDLCKAHGKVPFSQPPLPFEVDEPQLPQFGGFNGPNNLSPGFMQKNQPQSFGQKFPQPQPHHHPNNIMASQEAGLLHEEIHSPMLHFNENRMPNVPPFQELGGYFNLSEQDVQSRLSWIMSKFMKDPTFSRLSHIQQQNVVFDKFVQMHQQAALHAQKSQPSQQQQQQATQQPPTPPQTVQHHQESGAFSQPDGGLLSRQSQSVQEEIPSNHVVHDNHNVPQPEMNINQQQQSNKAEQVSMSNPMQMLHSTLVPGRLISGNMVPGAMSVEELEEMQKREAEEHFQKQQQQQQQQQGQFVRQSEEQQQQQRFGNDEEGFQNVEQRKRAKKAEKSQQKQQESNKQAPSPVQQSVSTKVQMIASKPEEVDTTVMYQLPIDSLSSEKQPQKCVWGGQATEEVNQSLSIAEIQKIQEEKEREERKKINEQMALMAGSNANNTTEGHFKWAHSWKEPSGGKVKTLAEIQAEEAEKVAIIREQQEAEAQRRVAAGAGVTPMSSIVAKSSGMPWSVQSSAAAPQAAPQVVNTKWEQTESKTIQNMSMKTSKPKPELIKQYLKTNPRNIRNLDDQQLLKISCETQEDLIRCSVEIIERAFDSVNAFGFVNIAKDANSPNEFVEYVQYYLGQSDSARAFSKFFVNKKFYLKKKQEGEKQQFPQQPSPQQPQQQPKKNLWDNQDESSSMKKNYNNLSSTQPKQTIQKPVLQQPLITNINDEYNIMNVNVETMKEFDTWCVEVLHQIDPVLDAETFVTFLKEIDSPDEIGEYVRSYIGSNKLSRDFTKNFLSKRSYLKNKNKEDELDEDLCAPAQALTPGKNDDSGFVTVNNNGKKKRKPKGKDGAGAAGNSNLPIIRTVTLD